jgi:predicted RNA binding protein YcfA (HicA-like mRNA interferase family)
MKRSELLRLFNKNNIILLEHGKRHDIYYSPITGKKIPVPRHAKEIAEGTLKSIKKDAGLE